MGMRISNAEIYNQQTGNINNLFAEQMLLGQELSSGLQVSVPSDNPSQIGQDLLTRATQAYDQAAGTTLTQAQAQLSSLDGTLSNLTSLMQTARQLAVQGAADTTSPQSRQNLATQVDALLQQAIALGNTQVNGVYLFAGTAQTSPPFQAIGSPVSAVGFTGNLQGSNDVFLSGQSYPVGVSAQQTFNLNAVNGSPSIFQVLIRLRDTLNGQSVVDESTASLNRPGTVISATSGISSAAFSTPLVADSTGNDSFQINGVTVTISQSTGTVASTLAAINAVSGSTGVVATFDYHQERLLLSSVNGQAFTVADVPSPGATGGAGNFMAAFGLGSQGSAATDVSTQLGDIDQAMNALLNGRAQVGSTIQALSSLQTSNQATMLQNSKTISGIEDANVAQATTQFTQTQTALQAAYAATAQLEQHSLFDYIQ